MTITSFYVILTSLIALVRGSGYVRKMIHICSICDLPFDTFCINGQLQAIVFQKDIITKKVSFVKPLYWLRYSINKYILFRLVVTNTVKLIE